MLVCNRSWGLWRFRRGLIEALLHRGIAVVAVTPPGLYMEKIVRAGARHIPVALDEFVAPHRDLRLCFALYRIFRAEKPDIVHNMTAKPNIYGSLAAWLAGVPKIVSLVCGAGYGFGEGGGWKATSLRFLIRQLYRISSRVNSRMYFLNPDDRNLFLDSGMIAPDRAVLVPSEGVDLDEFSPASVDQDEVARLRAELRIQPAMQVVLMVVGRAIWSKGVREFVEAAKRVQALGLAVKFVLVGPIDPGNPDSVPEEYLKNAASPWFAHLGTQADIASTLALGDVVVFPSYYREGVPRVLLEALAMGKPVVTTDSVGCREVVDHGKNGLLVPVKDAGALVTAILAILRDKELRTAFGARSRAKACKEFDERKIVAQILSEVYDLPAETPADRAGVQESRSRVVVSKS
jgi:N,N'-diacetylbacillosaminyl-diphospho-undecaprenol alpha-1,3-N-acetylgalactosaminyltransferase